MKAFKLFLVLLLALGAGSVIYVFSDQSDAALGQAFVGGLFFALAFDKFFGDDEE